MRNCEECIYQIKGSCSKFECKETTIEQFEQEIRNKVIDECIRAIEENKTLFDNHKTDFVMSIKTRCQNVLKNLKEKNNGRI